MFRKRYHSSLSSQISRKTREENGVEGVITKKEMKEYKVNYTVLLSAKDKCFPK